MGGNSRQATLFFKEYIEKWVRVKEESAINGNEGMYTLAKLMLNALYGKFATNPNVKSKNPIFDGELVKYELGELEERDPVYIPLASFVTAYAREKTIRTAQQHAERFIYADTDSLHLMGEEIPENLAIDSVKLGFWDFESKFKRGRFIRAKSYIEELYITETEYNNLKDGKKKGWNYQKEEKNLY